MDFSEMSRHAMFHKALFYIVDMFSDSNVKRSGGSAYVLEAALAFDNMRRVLVQDIHSVILYCLPVAV